LVGLVVDKPLIETDYKLPNFIQIGFSHRTEIPKNHIEQIGERQILNFHIFTMEVLKSRQNTKHAHLLLYVLHAFLALLKHSL